MMKLSFMYTKQTPYFWHEKLPENSFKNEISSNLKFTLKFRHFALQRFGANGSLCEDVRLRALYNALLYYSHFHTYEGRLHPVL